MAYRPSWVGKLTEGLLSTAVDLALVSIFYGLEFGSAGYGKGARAEAKAHEDLIDLNYQTIKRTFVYLRQKGLIQLTREKFTLPKITAEGKKRVSSLVSQYDEKRTWDKRIYLITYDLPVKRNTERDRLREFLRKIGCGRLQRSVWLTPYNPTKLIQEFAKEKNLEEGILVSSLGKDGTIGDWDLEELMREVYPLDELNLRYGEFLQEAKGGGFSRRQLAFRFLSILQDDPQLPFELLPDDWLGEHAYRLFQKMMK